MGSYVVRVYRFEEGESGDIFGTVEPVGGRERYSFAKIEDLWDILRRERSDPSGPTQQAPPCQGEDTGI